MKLLQVGLEDLLVFQGALQPTLIDLIIEQDSAIQLLYVLVHRLIAFYQVLVLVIQQADLSLELSNLLIWVIIA